MLGSMAERTAVEELDSLLDDAPEVFRHADHADRFTISAAATVIDELLQTAYRRRLSPPIKGKLMGVAFRLPVLRNAVLRSMERAREDAGGFVMRKVDSPGDMMAFDVEYCPLSTFFAQHDAVEVGPLVCKIDDLLVGTMPGITLRRTGTIANGALRCDFRYRREQ
jgi:hypothetical protein